CLVLGLNNGDYKIQFRAGDTGYATEWYEDKYIFDTADSVTISSLTDEVRDIELGTSTSISGTITDSEGAAIVGALVKVYENSGENFVDSPLEFATTGDDGSYTVNGLPANHSFFKVRFFEREGDGSGTGLTEWYDDASSFVSATTVNAGDTGVNAVLESSFNWLIFTPVLTHRPSL
ncbi:carboxypeptidase regulatory-like domain-containing protein, partial [Desulfobulbus sp. TB]|nr:carboxypeptidase regulatory-like domain-containing protein [Desulfobulbus sp. TB]